jgi:plasmid maintenance system antidote protein VapI
LSALTGVSEGSIRNMCDGGREPTPEMAGKIAAAVGADLSFIVKGRVA